MTYSNKPEETLAERVGPWLDRAMAKIADFQNETDPLKRAYALATAMDNLNVAAGRCASEFVFLAHPPRSAQKAKV